MLRVIPSASIQNGGTRKRGVRRTLPRTNWSPRLPNGPSERISHRARFLAEKNNGKEPATPTVQKEEQQEAIHETMTAQTHQAPQEQETPQTGDKQFTWTRNWWPIIPLNYLDSTRPTSAEILGIPLAIWQDGSGTWRCFKDMCPHRLAPLSEGRVEGGELMCSYHGWKFGGEGACSTIPQAPDPKSQAVATASPRSCALAFPTQEAGGLLWVWPDSAPTRWVDSAAVEPPLPNTVTAGGRGEALAQAWFMREVPYDYDILVENFADVSHLPFSHHGAISKRLNRYGDASLPFKPAHQDLTPDAPDHAGRPALGVYSYPFVYSSYSRLAFHPPSLLTYYYPDSAQTVNILYTVPTAPGRCRAIIGSSSATLVHLMGGPKSFSWDLLLQQGMLLRYITRKLLSTFTWAMHLGSQKVLDGDTVFLNAQGRYLRTLERLKQQQQQQEGGGEAWNVAEAGSKAAGKSVWVEQYFMPMSCDRGLVEARKWIDKVGGGGPTYAPEASPTPPMASRQQLLDRYNQHTKHCPHCRSGLASIGRVAAVCKALVASSCLALCCFAGHWGPARLVTGGLPSVATAATIIIGVVAAMAVRACRQLTQQFYFVDHVHADNH